MVMVAPIALLLRSGSLTSTRHRRSAMGVARRDPSQRIRCLVINIGNAVSATDEDSRRFEVLAEWDRCGGVWHCQHNRSVAEPVQLLIMKPRTSYSVTVNVSDGKGGTDDISVTIRVTDVNEAPTFSEGDSTTRFYRREYGGQ